MYTDLDASSYSGDLKTAYENGYCATALLCSSTYDYYNGVTLTSTASSARRAAAVQYNVQYANVASSIPTSGVSTTQADSLAAAINAAATALNVRTTATVGTIGTAVIDTSTSASTSVDHSHSSTRIFAGVVGGAVVLGGLVGIGLTVFGIWMCMSETRSSKKVEHYDVMNELKASPNLTMHTSCTSASTRTTTTIVETGQG